MGQQPPAMAAAVAVAAAVIIICQSQCRLANASACPLDMGWSNFTLAASACSDSNEIGKCCRYITSFVAVSVARYANVTGRLGVPPAFSQMCMDSISETLQMNGVPPTATTSCGLGTKILVTYQCKGRTTVLEMLQSPNFMDVVGNCKMPVSDSLDSSCKRCLNSGILYLHRLIGTEDNVTLSTCRDAAFVALANQGDRDTAVSLASCFFGVQGLGSFEVASLPLQAPETPTSPSSTSAASPPVHHLFGTSIKERSHHAYEPTIVQGIGMGVIGIAVLFLAILIMLIRRKSKELKDAASPVETSRSSTSSPAQKCSEDSRYTSPPFMFKRFTYKETKKATCDFSMLIGKGGFGTVYKAQFADGSMAAVKRMDKVSEQGEEDFCRELQLLARLHHRHLVTLKGFCSVKRERFLVYEYMENGSLKDHLHNAGKTSLSWQTRIQIAIDVANALEYLHFYCDPPLCHRDIKSSNILLDNNFVAKVADFGLAHASRTGSINFEPVNTDVRGTPGYMDPEYMVTQELTEKSDIYSYGVLLLELVTGRRAIQENRNLVEWSQKYMVTDSKLAELVDPRIADSFDLEQLRVIGWIIRWCTQREGRARPSIKQVLRMLHERLDQVHSDFARVSGDDNDDYCSFRIDKGKTCYSEMTTRTEDARGVMSSSSTTRSYCSRNFLLESGSPQSPTCNYFG